MFDYFLYYLDSLYQNFRSKDLPYSSLKEVSVHLDVVSVPGKKLELSGNKDCYELLKESVNLNRPFIQPAFICSKLTIETPEQGVEYVHS